MIYIEDLKLPLNHEVVCKDNFIVPDGKITCICGPSGSGKTTLLYLLGLIDDTILCKYWFDKSLINLKSDEEKSEYRKHFMGYVFQDSNLLLHLNIEENWRLAADLSGVEFSDSDVIRLMELLELDKTGKEKISELSGGQKQRVAIGMAMIKQPRLLLLDEPTSALDKNTALELMKLLKKLATDYHMMIVIATHSKNVKEQSDVLYEIINGEIVPVKLEVNKFTPSKKELLPSNFSILKYVWQYIKKFYKSKLLMTILCSLVLTFYIVSTTVSSQIIKRQEDMLNDLVNTEIKVSKNPIGAYYDENVEPFDQSVYQTIVSMDHVQDIVPIVALQTEVEHQEVDILPYNAVMGLEEFKNTKSCYVSYDLGKLLSSFSLELSVTYKGKSIEEKIEINGVLKSTYNNSYSKNKYVIYIEETLFYEMFGRLENLETFIPNTMLVYADYYANVNQLNLSISSVLNGGSVENEFVDLSSLNESTATFSNYLEIISISLCILLFLMLIIIYSRYLINREYECCILRANGLTKKEIRIMMEWDIILQSIAFIVCSFSFVVIICEGMKWLDLISDVSYIQTIVPICCVSICSLIIPMLIALKKVNQFSPAKFLRK